MNVAGREIEVDTFQYRGGWAAIGYMPLGFKRKYVQSAVWDTKEGAELDLYKQLLEIVKPPPKFDPNKDYGTEENVPDEHYLTGVQPPNRYAIYHDNRYDGVRSYWNGNTWVTRVEDAQLYSEKDSDAWLGYMAHLSGIKKMQVNTWRESAADIVSTLLEDGPTMQTLKQHQTKLTADERAQAGGHPIKKSVVKGKTYFWSNTHRCYQSATTIAKAVKDYVEIVEPSG